MIYFKVSRSQMNKALLVFNNALAKANEEIKEIEVGNHSPEYVTRETKRLEDKKEKLKKYIEIVNFSIRQTKLKEFFVDYDFAVLMKSILFIEEK